MGTTIPEEHRADIETLWDFHQMHPEHDPTVPEVAVDLFNRRGEAVHYGEYGIEHGVPAELVLLATRARSTPKNIVFRRELLAEQGQSPTSAIVVSRPYQQRRVYGIARKLWPELDVACAFIGLRIDDYVQPIGDVNRVIGAVDHSLNALDLSC